MLVMTRRSSLAFAAAFLSLGAPARTNEPVELGAWPLCEASAATRDPSSDRRVWIADNERSGDLFGFELRESGLESMQRLAMPGGNGLRDIEALATAGDRMLVVASHSRNERCDYKPKRWQLRWLRAPRGGALTEEATIDDAALRAGIAMGAAGCVEALFGRVEISGARAVCEVLSAEEIRDDRADCRALDIEGAVAVAEAGRGDEAVRIWLGLRNPLVAGRAVLLRLANESQAFRFDAVATIDLGGRGVRELAYSEGLVWGIAGPAGDSKEPFGLFGISSSALIPGARIAEPARQRQLLPLSEGLLIDGARAVVVTDGEAGEPHRKRCLRPSSQYSVELP